MFQVVRPTSLYWLTIVEWACIEISRLQNSELVARILGFKGQFIVGKI
jgi:hypothetical protein